MWKRKKQHVLLLSLYSHNTCLPCVSLSWTYFSKYITATLASLTSSIQTPSNITSGTTLWLYFNGFYGVTYQHISLIRCSYSSKVIGLDSCFITCALYHCVSFGKTSISSLLPTFLILPFSFSSFLPYFPSSLLSSYDDGDSRWYTVGGSFAQIMSNADGKW